MAKDHEELYKLENTGPRPCWLCSGPKQILFWGGYMTKVQIVFISTVGSTRHMDLHYTWIGSFQNHFWHFCTWASDRTSGHARDRSRTEIWIEHCAVMCNVVRLQKQTPVIIELPRSLLWPPTTPNTRIQPQSNTWLKITYPLSNRQAFNLTISKLHIS